MFSKALNVFRAAARTPETLSPAESARAEVARLAELERNLFRELVEKGARARSGEALGALAIDGGDPAELVAEVGQVNAELELMEQSLAVAHRRRMEALTALARLEAEEYRAKAATLRRQAQTIHERVAPLLEKLSELEGIAYDRGILLAQRRGHWEKIAAYGTEGLSLSDCAPNEAVCDPTGSYAVPRSRALLVEALQLEEQAGALERRDLSAMGGYVTADSPAQLMDAMLADPSKPTPSLSVLWGWLRQVEAKIPPGNCLQRQYRLRWVGQAIDTFASLIAAQRVGSRQGDCIEYRA